MNLRLAIPIVLLSLAVAAPGAAQTVPFGKNKIQYRDFQWRILAGEHVDVYYYPEEEALARLTLAYAEESFAFLERKFQHHPFERIPLVVYSSHRHFEQTNILPGFIPEGVLGFTEYLKRRVALPFRGDYAQFRRTLRHELVHAFQISKIAEVEALHPKRKRFTPQQVHWWTEGLAELWSGAPTSGAEMYNRDLVLTGRVPRIHQFSRLRSYASYPLGSALHAYLVDRFGEEYIVRVYEDFWQYRTIEEALEAALGTDLATLDREWRHSLQQRYFPVYGERSPPEVAAVPVVYRRGGAFQPAVHIGAADTTATLYFLSGRTGYTGLYRTPLRAGEEGVELVLEGEKSAELESLHAYESGIDVTTAGAVAFVSKHLERDALFVWDERRGGLAGRYRWPDLVALRSPAWDPEGRRVVFEGLSTAGQSDLYLLDFETQQRVRLTADAYRDTDPDWAPDGQTLVFASDRTPFGADGNANLYLLDLRSGQVRPLTHGPWRDRDPRWSHDGTRIAFSSDRGGTPDLYVVDREGSGRRVTALTGGATDPDWLPGDDGLVFAGFSEGAYRIYRFRLGEDTISAPAVSLDPAADTAHAAAWTWEGVEAPAVAGAERRDYRSWRQISVDVAGGDAVLAPGLGAAQGAQFLASDMLGNHMLFGGITAVQASSFAEFVDNFSANALYLNLTHRLNFGAGLFRFRGLYRDVAFDLYRDARHGGFFVASYPFSKFKRLEYHFVLEQSDRRAVVDAIGGFFGGPREQAGDERSRSGLLASHYLAFVRDNTLWLATGPIDGERYNVTAGFVACFACRLWSEAAGARVGRRAAAEQLVVSADYRRYVRTTTRSAYALRAHAFFSEGAIPGRAVLGGPHRLRGYPRFSLAGSRLALLNQEWRFPLLHALDLAFPFGTVRVPGIQGAVFGDVGTSWLEGTRPEGAWGSYGAAFRVPLGPPLVLRLDVGRRFRWGAPPPGALGREVDFGSTFVDFFFGYNY